MSNDAGDVDDGASALCLEAGRHHLHTLDGTEQIGLEQSAAFVHRHRGYGIQQPVTSIVDPDVDLPKTVLSPGGQSVDLATLAYVTRNRHSAVEVSHTAPGLFQPGEIARAQHDACAFGEESASKGLADSHGGAGYNHYLIAAPHRIRLYLHNPGGSSLLI